MTLAIIALALLGHAAWIQVVQPDVPYMDSMRMLVYQQAWRDGAMSLFGLWEPGSPHHGLLAPMLLWANVAFFGLDARLANHATGVVIAAICALTAFVFLSDRHTAPPSGAPPRALPRVVAVVVLALLFFSLAGFELLTLELGLALWMKNLLFVGYFLVHQAWLRKPAPDAATSFALALAGAAIVLLAGMGWSYGFAAAVIGTQVLATRSAARDRGIDALLRWLPAIALVLALVVYAALGTHKGASARAPLAASTALLPFYSLGSTWVGSEAYMKSRGPEFAFFVAGAATLFAGAWALYRRWRRGMFSGSLLPVYFLGYGGTCAVLFSLARGGWGIPGVVASRYFMDLVLFLIGTLWLLYEDAASRRDGAARVSGVACIALAAIVVAGHAWTDRVEWYTAPWRAQAFDRIEEAFRRGATTPEDARAMQAPQPFAAQGVAVLRARRLSVFRNDAAATCNADAARRSDGWYGAEPFSGNRWMQRTARIELPPCGCGAKTAVYLPPGFAARDLLVDTDGAKASLALVPGKLVPLTLPAGSTWRTTRLSVSAATVPVTDIAGSVDKRTLGALFGPLRFELRGARHRAVTDPQRFW